MVNSKKSNHHPHLLELSHGNSGKFAFVMHTLQSKLIWMKNNWVHFPAVPVRGYEVLMRWLEGLLSWTMTSCFTALIAHLRKTVARIPSLLWCYLQKRVCILRFMSCWRWPIQGREKNEGQGNVNYVLEMSLYLSTTVVILRFLKDHLLCSFINNSNLLASIILFFSSWYVLFSGPSISLAMLWLYVG